MHTKRIAIAALSLSLLAACGGDDSGADPAVTSTTEDPSEAAEAALAELLLTPADLDTGNELDAGWELGDVAEGVDIELPACITEDVDPDAAASASAKLVTRNDLKLPSLEQYLGTYEGSGASDAFDDAAARLDACEPAFVFQGEPAEGDIERLPLDLGVEQGAAWRTSVTIAGSGVAITNVHLVDGDMELAMVHVDLGEPDPALLEALFAEALAKLSS